MGGKIKIAAVTDRKLVADRRKRAEQLEEDERSNLSDYTFNDGMSKDLKSRYTNLKSKDKSEDLKRIKDLKLIDAASKKKKKAK